MPKVEKISAFQEDFKLNSPFECEESMRIRLGQARILTELMTMAGTGDVEMELATLSEIGMFLGDLIVDIKTVLLAMEFQRGEMEAELKTLRQEAAS